MDGMEMIVIRRDLLQPQPVPESPFQLPDGELQGGVAVQGRQDPAGARRGGRHPRPPRQRGQEKGASQGSEGKEEPAPHRTNPTVKWMR